MRKKNFPTYIKTPGLSSDSAKVWVLCALLGRDGIGGIVLQDVQTPPSNTHALEVSPHGTWFSFSQKTLSHLRQASWMCHVLARWESHLFVRQKQRSVYLGLLDWQCPLSKRRFSCHRLKKKWGLICISLIPPPLPALLEKLHFLLLLLLSKIPRCSMPQYRL